jgi:hypothetical protein
LCKIGQKKASNCNLFSKFCQLKFVPSSGAATAIHENATRVVVHIRDYRPADGLSATRFRYSIGSQCANENGRLKAKAISENGVSKIAFYDLVNQAKKSGSIERDEDDCWTRSEQKYSAVRPETHQIEFSRCSPLSVSGILKDYRVNGQDIRTVRKAVFG